MESEYNMTLFLLKAHTWTRMYRNQHQSSNHGVLVTSHTTVTKPLSGQALRRDFGSHFQVVWSVPGRVRHGVWEGHGQGRAWCLGWFSDGNLWKCLVISW